MDRVTDCGRFENRALALGLRPMRRATRSRRQMKRPTNTANLTRREWAAVVQLGGAVPQDGIDLFYSRGAFATRAQLVSSTADDFSADQRAE